MMTRSIATLAICILFIVTSHAQTDAEKAQQKAEEKLSVKKGDPPPGNALAMPVSIARLIVRDLVSRRHLFSQTGVGSYLESSGLKFSKEGLGLEYGFLQKDKRISRSVNILYKKIDYVKSYPSNDDSGRYYSVFGGGSWTHYFDENVFAWKDKQDAEEFRRALNRLIYEAWHESSVADELSGFSINVATWKANPSSAPPKPADWDKYRVLAEQAVNETDFVAAARHYEEGVAAYPLWAEGWFNAALIYDGLKEYEYAANRMRHYLLLMPDAPDAKVAREKVIVWEEKAKH